jgi:hypothetical protein
VLLFNRRLMRLKSLLFSFFRPKYESHVMSMFEKLFIRLAEWTVLGKPIQAFLAETTSISRKTWDAGGPKRPAAKARAAKEVRESVIQHLRDKGISEEEIEAWLSRFPATTDEEPYYFSNLTRSHPVNQEPPPETLALSIRMDELAHALWKANCNGDLGACKNILLDSTLLDKYYFADTERELRNDDTPLALSQARSATNWEELDASIKVVTANLLFSLMGCWDLEFCRVYFPSMKSFPLFEIVMLNATHDLNENPKLSRDTFHRPTRNLLDLMAMLGSWIRNHGTKTLQKVQVKQMESWLELGDPQIPAQKLWNWRSGRDAFVCEDLKTVWLRFTGAYDDKKKEIPPPPLPLFIAARIWENLQIQIDSEHGNKTYFFLQPWYLWWWEYHRARLAAKGVTWGDRPWPACIRNQSSWSGTKSPDSSLSSQSSGLSSKSRDSQ